MAGFQGASPTKQDYCITFWIFQSFAILYPSSSNSRVIQLEGSFSQMENSYPAALRALVKYWDTPSLQTGLSSQEKKEVGSTTESTVLFPTHSDISLSSLFTPKGDLSLLRIGVGGSLSLYSVWASRGFLWFLLCSLLLKIPRSLSIKNSMVKNIFFKYFHIFHMQAFDVIICCRVPI